MTGAKGASVNSHSFLLSTSSLPPPHPIELLMVGQRQEPKGRMWPYPWHVLTTAPLWILSSFTYLWGWGAGVGHHFMWGRGSARRPACLVTAATSLLWCVSQTLSITSFHLNFSQEVICKCFAYAGHIWSNDGREKAVQMLPCCLLDTRGQIFLALVQVSSPSLIYYRKIRENWSPGTGGYHGVIKGSPRVP